MEKPLLSDASQFPSEEIIFAHLGKAKPLWTSLFEHIHAVHPDITEEWRYYNDGKSWLMKVTRKKKTVFWLSIVKGAFRTTFYFTDKAEAAIVASDLPDDLKRQFADGKTYGKIRGLTVVHASKQNTAAAKTLIERKLSIK